MPRARRVHRSASAALAGLVALGLLAGCGDGDAVQLDVGETRDHAGDVTGQDFEVRVPSGAITVTVGEPTQSVEAGSGDLAAPEDGALVPVSWSLDRYQESPVTGFDQETDLSIITAEGEATVATIPDGPTNASGGAVVAVGGDGEVAAVGATYDGVEQRLDADGTRDAGVAELLYERPADTATTDCSQDWRLEPRARVEVECSARTWVLPYLPEAGWAAEGSAHVLVEPTVSLWKVTSAGHQYRATLGPVESIGEGTFEAGVGGTATLDGLLVAQSAQVPLRWTLEATYRLRSRAARGPWDGREVTLVGGGIAGS